MPDFVLDEQKRPSMFPQDYIHATNTAILRTMSIPRIGELHRRIKNLHGQVFTIENAGKPHPGKLYVELDTLLFELKAISYLLSEYSSDSLEYEPSGDNPQGKRVDLRLGTDSESQLVEFKTTNPQVKEGRVPVEHFSANTLQADPMCYNWLSGARSHLLEYLVDAENKSLNYSGSQGAILCVYKNFYIEEDELEALWQFYLTGVPRADDAFGGMMQYEMNRKGLHFSNSITELWALSFPQYGFELHAEGSLRFRR